jgi:RNA polymerase sigma-70 factor (ECF subfamily)
MTPDSMPDSAPDDTALVRACQRGDREAFGILISRHAGAVLNVASRMLGPTADAEDVAQEAFVAAYKSIGSFQLDARFSTWLHRIAVNKCTDALRARRNGTVPLEGADDEAVHRRELADPDTPHWELEQAELAWELDKGIQSLPPLYRESFVLRHVEGLGYDEMSTILGVSRDTLKMRVYKARTLLCQTLAHLNGALR